MSDHPWEPTDVLDIVRVEEGETGKLRNQRLTAERLEEIAIWKATSQAERVKQNAPLSIGALADRLRCSPASVRKWLRSPRMKDRVDHYLSVSATFGMADIMGAQMKKAVDDGDTNAAKFVDSIRLPRGNGGTQVNVGVAIRTQGSESDAQFWANHQSSMSRAVIRQFTPKPDPTDDDDDEPEPEPA